MQTIHARIDGRVQGVFFRDRTRQQADKLSVTGWVKNMPDGSVEAVLQGSDSNVQKMLDWLHTGPPQADVSRVTTRQVDEAQEFNDFNIRY